MNKYFSPETKDEHNERIFTNARLLLKVKGIDAAMRYIQRNRWH